MNTHDLPDMVECFTVLDQRKRVPRAKLSFRPAVYGVLLHDGCLLMTRIRSSGKWGLPGGGVELGERLEDALLRELREETGISAEIERFERFEQAFFYYDPHDEAYHALQFFYRCRPLTTTLATDDQIEDGEAIAPSWVPLRELHQGNVQHYSRFIVGYDFPGHSE
jgi:8-oxo-dGTP pyrophosphatase MutT (NUDIX family)